MIKVDDMDGSVDRTAISHLQRCTALAEPSLRDR
jgi:hypothetical protein